MTTSGRRRAVAVAGPGTCDAATAEQACALGVGLAGAGLVVVTGGRGGVMDAASRGAREAGGLVVALLPGTDRDAATQWADVVLPTGLGDARNALVARAGDVLVAFLAAGGPGTLGEVALALKARVPVVLVGPPVTLPIDLPADAVVRHAARAPDALRHVAALLDPGA